jgi:hypothetical protein
VGKIEKRTKILDPGKTPLFTLRTGSQLYQQIRVVPHLFQEPGPARPDTRGHQIKLVMSRLAHYDRGEGKWIK